MGLNNLAIILWNNYFNKCNYGFVALNEFCSK